MPPAALSLQPSKRNDAFFDCAILVLVIVASANHSVNMSEQQAKTSFERLGWRLLNLQRSLAGSSSAPFAACVLSGIGTMPPATLSNPQAQASIIASEPGLSLFLTTETDIECFHFSFSAIAFIAAAPIRQHYFGESPRERFLAMRSTFPPPFMAMARWPLFFVLERKTDPFLLQRTYDVPPNVGFCLNYFESIVNIQACG